VAYLNLNQVHYQSWQSVVVEFMRIGRGIRNLDLYQVHWQNQLVKGRVLVNFGENLGLGTPGLIKDEIITIIIIPFLSQHVVYIWNVVVWLNSILHAPIPHIYLILVELEYVFTWFT